MLLGFYFVILNAILILHWWFLCHSIPLWSLLIVYSFFHSFSRLMGWFTYFMTVIYLSALSVCSFLVLILGISLCQTDWDLRLACLLLFAFDCEDNFWQLYSDFLPSADECPSLLLATEVCASVPLFMIGIKDSDFQLSWSICSTIHWCPLFS